MSRVRVDLLRVVVAFGVVGLLFGHRPVFAHGPEPWSWSWHHLGASEAPPIGVLTEDREGIRSTGRGAGFASAPDGGDDLLFAFQEVSGENFLVQASLLLFGGEGDRSGAATGFMMRASSDPLSPFVSVRIRKEDDGRLEVDLLSRAVHGDPVVIASPQPWLPRPRLPVPYWLRLDRFRQDFYGASVSSDGVSWNELGRWNLSLPAIVQAGFLASNGPDGVPEEGLVVDYCDPHVLGQRRDVANWAPFPFLELERDAQLGLAFDARSSRDRESEVADFSLDFGDGSDPSTEPEGFHRYAEAGVYELVLRVRDDGRRANGNPAPEAREAELRRTIVIEGEAPVGPLFQRGDADGSGSRNLSDPIFVLTHLFRGGEAPACPDAADADDSGSLTLTDPIVLLESLFLGAGSIAPPLLCGGDVGEDALGECRYESCP